MSIKKQGKLFFLFAAWLLFFAGKSTSDVTLLTRSWKLADLRYSISVSKDVQERVDKAVEDMKKDFTLTYHADGSYTAGMKGSFLGGKWRYSADSGKLSVITDQGIAKDYKVMQLTSDTFAFITREGNEDAEFVMVPVEGTHKTWIWIALVVLLVLAVSAFIAYRSKAKKIS